MEADQTRYFADVDSADPRADFVDFPTSVPGVEAGIAADFHMAEAK